jgi:hypothetical protein
MEGFKGTIQIVVNVLIVVSIIQLYLRANRIWKRKHEKEVAESQSIAGLSLLMLSCTIWIIYYIVTEDYSSIVDTLVIMAEASIFLLVSTGLWIKGQEKVGFWKLVKQALKMETKEADYLLKRFFRPANAENILHILHQLAMIDNELDPKEQAILSAFAKEWNIHYSPEELNTQRGDTDSHNYQRLRKSVHDYLTSDPPVEQAAQLRDMMRAIIDADDKTSKEEELISTELMALISNYLVEEEKVDVYHVLVVPQKPDDESRILDIAPDALRINISGGVAFSVGSFYSSVYAEMICKQYREYILFTIVHSPEDEDELKILKTS